MEEEEQRIRERAQQWKENIIRKQNKRTSNLAEDFKEEQDAEMKLPYADTDLQQAIANSIREGGTGRPKKQQEHRTGKRQEVAECMD